MNEIKLKGELLESEFLNEIQKRTGQVINTCYQCKKCAVGCPVVYTMDYTPTQIIHAIRFGLKDLVLNSRTIWVCSSCETCTTRCPQEVDIAKVMDVARIIAQRENIKPKVPDVSIFFKSAIQNIGFFGKLYEFGLIMILKLKTKEFFKDVILGLKMIKNGKMRLFPDIFSIGKARKIVSKVKQIERK
jgi:heterodisulfide reductase subunit C